MDIEFKQFHKAADNGHLDMMKLLQNDKEVINSKDDTKIFRTALHKAAVQGNLMMAAYLIEKGAEIEPKDNNEGGSSWGTCW